jgi:hypothetical protein
MFIAKKVTGDFDPVGVEPSCHHIDFYKHLILSGLLHNFLTPTGSNLYSHEGYGGFFDPVGVASSCHNIDFCKHLIALRDWFTISRPQRVPIFIAKKDTEDFSTPPGSHPPVTTLISANINPFGIASQFPEPNGFQRL